MIASFSDAVRIIRRPRSHTAESDFFESVIARVQLGSSLLQFLILFLEARHLIGVRPTSGLACHSLLAL